jgi:hypothetical protein
MVAIMGQIGEDKTNTDHDTATIEQQLYAISSCLFQVE